MAVNLPSIPSSVDPSVRRAFDIIKNELQAAQASRTITADDLVAAGAVASNGQVVSPAIRNSVPPKPTDVTVVGAFRTILVSWNDHGYARLAYAVVYRASVNDFSQALEVGTTTSRMYADNPPNASLAQTYYYWVRLVSVANVNGPLSDVAFGNTANDPGYVLEVLSGQITSSQLHSSLSEPINLINADNVGIVSVLDRLGTALSSLTAADADRWERLLYERQVTDATVEIAPAAYCTLPAYTSEATCVAAGGVWKPAGTIRLKATADITSDIDASLRTLQTLYDAINGTVTTQVGITSAHSDTIASYLTDANSTVAQLASGLSSKASASYVDLKTDAIATAADVATYAAEHDIPTALAYMVLHVDDAAKKLRGATANIATHAQEILSTATALEAESHFRTELDAKVDANRAELISNYYTKATIDSASTGWINQAVADSATATGTALNSYSTTSEMNTAIADSKSLIYASLNATFRQDTAPTVRGDGSALKAGDVWFDTTLNAAGDKKNDLYLYDGRTPYNVAGWILSPNGQTTANGAAIAVEQNVRATTIAPLFDPTKSYAAGKCVIWNSTLYQNATNATILPGEWNQAQWKVVTADLYAQYTVKAEVTGPDGLPKVTGFGFSNDGSVGIFEIVADKFGIHAPPPAWAGTKAYVPGMRVTSGGKTYKAIANSINMAPPNVAYWEEYTYLIPFAVDNEWGGAVMDVAFIKDASIGSAKIQSLTADLVNAVDIDAGSIVTGTLDATKITISGDQVTVSFYDDLPDYDITGLVDDRELFSFDVASGNIGKPHIFMLNYELRGDVFSVGTPNAIYGQIAIYDGSGIASNVFSSQTDYKRYNLFVQAPTYSLTTVDINRSGVYVPTVAGVHSVRINATVRADVDTSIAQNQWFSIQVSNR